eukprot:Rmarinus@m.4847
MSSVLTRDRDVVQTYAQTYGEVESHPRQSYRRDSKEFYKFDDYIDSRNSPYFILGDDSLYEEEHMTKRESLQQFASVTQAIDEFWDLAKKNFHEMVEEVEFVRICMRICKALIPCYQEDEALAFAKEEFRKAAKGLKGLKQPQFAAWLFNVADTWTVTTSGAEYGAFLSHLYRAITNKLLTRAYKTVTQKPPRPARSEITRYTSYTGIDCTGSDISFGEDKMSKYWEQVQDSTDEQPEAFWLMAAEAWILIDNNFLIENLSKQDEAEAIAATEKKMGATAMRRGSLVARRRSVEIDQQYEWAELVDIFPQILFTPRFFERWAQRMEECGLDPRLSRLDAADCYSRDGRMLARKRGVEMRMSQYDTQNDIDRDADTQLQWQRACGSSLLFSWRARMQSTGCRSHTLQNANTRPLVRPMLNHMMRSTKGCIVQPSGALSDKAPSSVLRQQGALQKDDDNGILDVISFPRRRLSGLTRHEEDMFTFVTSKRHYPPHNVGLETLESGAPAPIPVFDRAQWELQEARRTPLTILVLGKPRAGKSTLAKKMAEAWDLVHINPEALAWAEVQNRGPWAKVVAPYLPKVPCEEGDYQDPLLPQELEVSLVLSALESRETMRRGFVMDDFPRTTSEVNAVLEVFAKYRSEGAYPDDVPLPLIVVDLQMTERDVCLRAKHIVQDPVTGQLYYCEQLRESAREEVRLREEKQRMRMIKRKRLEERQARIDNGEEVSDDEISSLSESEKSSDGEEDEEDGASGGEADGASGDGDGDGEGEGEAEGEGGEGGG